MDLFAFLQNCFKYYMSDDISKDSEGMDEQCRYMECVCERQFGDMVFITLDVFESVFS